MRYLLPILTGLAMALGLVHLGLSGLMSWRAFSLDTLWFAGSGLAILVAALINVIMIRARQIDRVQNAVWLVANLVLTGFFGLAWLLLKEPQVVVGGLVFALLSAGVAGRSILRA
ncbi:MAG: hypothetical protein ACOVQ6_18250 [Brevundimonas sp.]|jgi:hypothetical protein